MTACPVCQKDRWKSFDDRRGHAFDVCRGCGWTRRRDLPTPEVLKQTFDAPGAGPRGVLYNQSLHKKPLRAALLDAMERLQPPERLLDVGCGYGFFLDEARNRGWDVRGLEVSAPERAYARETLNLSVKEHFLEECFWPDASFDAVTFLEVLEFMPDPVGSLKEAHRLLAPGGWVWIRAYDARFHRWAIRIFSSLFLRWMKARAGILHLNAFPPKALARALRAAGFEDVRAYPSLFTAGDPHRQGGWLGSLTVRFGKFLVGTAARFLHALTGSVFSSSYLIRARKPAVRKRVLHLITRLDTGGSTENVCLTATGVDPKRFVSFLAAGGDKKMKGTLRLPSLVRNVSPRKDFRAFREIRRLCRDLRPDIVHTHSSKAGFLGRWAARAAGVPHLVHTPHGHVFYGYFSRFKSRFYAFLEKQTARVTDRLVALTPGERRESLERGVGTPNKWRVIPSGASWDDDVYHRREEHAAAVRRSHGVPAGALVIGSVMRLDPVKGPRVLAEAADHLLRLGEDFYLLLVGEGPERAAVEAVQKTLPDPDRFVLVGNKANPFIHMAAMDVYVQPSLNEGMGKTLVMAQAMGLPVAASRVCGIPDVVVENETALLVPPGDPKLLAGALRRLLAGKGLRERLGATGRERVSTFGLDGYLPFSVDRMVHLQEALYAEVLGL